jgi:hypothetical protein
VGRTGGAPATALDTLSRLRRKDCTQAYFILDETQTLKRWAIELLIKDEKQQLRLGDYRVLRYRAVLRHLHLVDIAYACLTRLALKDQREQGQAKKAKVLRLPPISQLKARMRQVVWQEAVEDVVKHSHEKTVVRRLEKLLAAA